MTLRGQLVDEKRERFVQALSLAAVNAIMSKELFRGDRPSGPEAQVRSPPPQNFASFRILRADTRRHTDFF